ncbi:MAG: tRNA 2-thiouridine(34) synthase MnmA [Aureliella sp.]
MKRVVLAMSGGVDSSAAAHLLLEQGYDVIGVFMRHGEESAESCSLEDGSPNPLLPILQGRTDHKQGCCSASDAMDARRVADRLGIPFYALDLQSDFSRIVDYFVDEYTHGRTPNPCVQCNNWIKFGRLFDYADSVDAEFVATGHYAQLVDRDGQPALIRGVDGRKDQSYVLAGIDRKYLSRMLLPVGGFVKPDIRRLAGEAGLRVADKRDSQEICFVTSGKHGEFVKARSGSDSSGNFVSTTGEVLGQHNGIERFTIGQRKGLGIALGEPRFVVRIDSETYDVVLGNIEDLDQPSLTATDANWLIPTPTKPFAGMAQIRYNSRAVPATIEPNASTGFSVRFDEPARGIAPGQLCVVYDEDRVLGGGWIE